MKKIIITIPVLCLLLVSCSHNQGTVILGKGFLAGAEGLKYFNGVALLDNSRENSEWGIEIDDEDGITVQDGNIKGIKKIERKIGKQVTGYLVDLAEEDPEAVNKYLEGK